MSASGLWSLPNNWDWSVFGDVAIITGGGTPSAKDEKNFSAEGGIPWITPADLTGYESAYISHGRRNLSEKGYKSSSAKILPKKAVLFTSRAPIGYCAIASSEIATNQGFKSLTLSCGISPEYTRKYLIWSKPYLESLASGTTFLELSGSKLAEASFPLPPLAEQKRIVAKLDALATKSARARTDLARIDTLVTRYKQAVLRSAYKGKLTSDWRSERVQLESAAQLIDRTPEPKQPRGGRIATETVIQGKAALSVNPPNVPAPPYWSWVNLNRVARQETGHTPSRSHPEWWDGDVPWIGIKDAGAHHGQTIFETFQTTNEDGLANSAARLLPEGTVCLSRTASVGYVTMLGKPMATSQDFVTWTCTEALSPKFLMYALMAEGDDIRDFGKGTTHTTIYFPEVRAMHICLAPLDEQHEIVRCIESAFQKIDRLAADAKRALELVRKLDEAILAKAFKGQLVPQDPNDEPASILLEHIKAERAAAPKGKRGRGM
ncbi:restriction endonuclease subunit S [Hoeflea sp. AS60]|uniref:restriction endonuclease subunit S n=1 Tax=Hoeflea sp. AS60 TaxID=3135780 RepID=UPI003181BB34